MSSQDHDLKFRIMHPSHFSLAFQFVRAERVSSVGYVSWLFAVRCAIHHSQGLFFYKVRDLYFSLDAFERFHRQLVDLQEWRRQTAVLTDDGEMVSFELCRDGHKLKSLVRIREYQPEDDFTTLNAGFWVDYDTFVNGLSAELGAFIRVLREVSPHDV